MKKGESYFLKALVATFILSYLLNLLWEVAHSALYNWDKLPLKNDVYSYIPRILGAALGDAFIISLIFLLNCLLRKGCKWITYPEKRDYIILIICGLLSSVIIELNALFSESWSYSQYMPLIFGIGLTPLIQLAITGAIVMFFVRKLIWLRNKRI